MNNNVKYTGLEIAIVGIGCRFPGADNWREYWTNLTNGIESVEFLSDQELADIGADPHLISSKNFINARSVLKDKDLFDASFFNYSPAEALLLNPVHKIFHHCVWEALEDAGYDPEQVQGAIGLYAGASDDLYWKVYSGLENIKEQVDHFSLQTINNKDYLSSLVSYKLNLKGPSFTVNTACSTSLVAVNLACKSLLLGEVKMALAGGVSFTTRKQAGYVYQEGLIFSADGHCRSFDKSSSGTITGEGAGVVVLKRLTDALNDGDEIYAIIKGSAMSNDGNRKVGFAAPGIEGQVECIRKALIFSRVEPETVTYIETHGTGTRLGDTIEIEALNAAFNRNSSHRCAIGSVKTNFGHLDTAAGVAGLIKAALSLKFKQIPPSLHFTEPNPEVNFKDGPFYVNAALTEWQRIGNLPLRAGVSSFGIGGTNVHAVLEEAPDHTDNPSIHKFKLITLSANTPGSLLRYVHTLKRFLLKEPDINMADMAYTLQVGRKHFPYRLALTCTGINQLRDQLEKEEIKNRIVRAGGTELTAVFMFTGQGSQYTGMGKDLYKGDPLFREIMDKGFSIIKEQAGEDFKEVLFPAVEGTDKIDQTRYTQPILFLVEYSLARLLITIGITPKFMIGHSIGEYVAACISGVFSFEDALRLVVKRGYLMNSLPRGAMLSLSISEEEVKPWLSDSISLAAVNGPEQVVLSGDQRSVDALKLRLDQHNISFYTLHTSHAFHSAMLDAIIKEYKKELEKVRFGTITIPFVSNLTGKFIKDDQANSVNYWLRQMRETVKFSEGVRSLLAQNRECLFIEAGAGHTLTSLVKQQQNALGVHALSLNLMRSVKETGEDDLEYLTNRIGQLWVRGFYIDWNSYYDKEKRRRIPLPTYRFEPTRYPVETGSLESRLVSAFQGQTERHNAELKDWVYYPFWQRSNLLASVTDTAQKNYLFFSFDEAFSGAVRKQLLTNGSDLTEVFAGEDFKKLSDDRYVIDPLKINHFDRLLYELKKNRVAITDIIYSWVIGVNPEKLVLEKDNLEINLSYFCLVNITRALLKAGELKNIRIIVLTDSLHRVIGTENGACTQSLSVGLMNVLMQEHPVSCCNIDFNHNEPVIDLVKELSEEITNGRHRKDRVVALRFGQRWTQQFQKNTNLVPGGKTMIKKGGVYLITGGMGNLGFVLAKHLLKHYEAKVILTGRRQMKAMPDAAGEEKGNIYSRFTELKKISRDVSYFEVDVADPEGLRQLVEEIYNTTGAINGVIHAAGIIDSGYFELIEDMSPARSLEMLRPKIAGLRNIYDIFGNKTPDFVWVTSSVAVILGGLGFGSYSAANLFMDHFISSNSDHLVNWKCLDLAEMIFSGETAGMDGHALTPPEIIALFEWSLLMDAPVIAESKRDLSTRIREVYEVRKGVHPDESISHEPIHKRERPYISTGYVEAITATEIQLKAVFENFLGIADIGTEDNFFELGGDSLKGMMLIKRIRQEFDCNLTLADFFKRPTIRSLASFIDEIRLLSKETARASKMII